MATVTDVECVEGLVDICLPLTFRGLPMAVVRGYLETPVTEEEVRDLLLNAEHNPTGVLLEIYPRGTQGISNSVGQHEIRRDHFLTIDAHAVFVQGGRDRLYFVADLFNELHGELLQYGNVRSGTGNPGTQLLPWQKAFDPRAPRDRGKVPCYFAQYTTQLRNQPEETTL